MALVVIGLRIWNRHRQTGSLQLPWPFRIALLTSAVVLWSGTPLGVRDCVQRVQIGGPFGRLVKSLLRKARRRWSTTAIYSFDFGAKQFGAPVRFFLRLNLSLPLPLPPFGSLRQVFCGDFQAFSLAQTHEFQLTASILDPQ